MNLQEVFCSNVACYDRFKKGTGNIVSHKSDPAVNAPVVVAHFRIERT